MKGDEPIEVDLFTREIDEFLLVSLKVGILQSELIECILEDDISRTSLVNEHQFDLGINHHSRNNHGVIMAENNSL